MRPPRWWATVQLARTGVRIWRAHRAGRPVRREAVFLAVAVTWHLLEV